MSEAVIVSGVRTAIGNYGGALQDVPASKLGAVVIQAALKKAGLRPVGETGYGPEALKDQRRRRTARTWTRRPPPGAPCGTCRRPRRRG